MKVMSFWSFGPNGSIIFSGLNMSGGNTGDTLGFGIYYFPQRPAIDDNHGYRDMLTPIFATDLVPFPEQ
jgi:hypothetical protein